MKPGSSGPRLIHGPVGKSILSLMLPMMMGMVALLSYNLADTWFIGQLGTMELAAISFTFHCRRHHDGLRDWDVIGCVQAVRR